MSTPSASNMHSTVLACMTLSGTRFRLERLSILLVSLAALTPRWPGPGWSGWP